MFPARAGMIRPVPHAEPKHAPGGAFGMTAKRPDLEDRTDGATAHMATADEPPISREAFPRWV